MTVVNQYPIVESGPAWLGLLLSVCFGILGFIGYLGLDGLQIQDSNIVRNFLYVFLN